MRVLRAIGAVATVVVLIQACAAVLPVAQAATAATTASTATGSPGTTLFVDSGASCSKGDGTPAHPFCTISAAAAVVQPGQTVVVEAGSYDENVTITRSGTASAPITFIGVGYVRVGGGGNTTVKGTAITVSGAKYVSLQRLIAVSGTGGEAITVTDSSHITIGRGSAWSLDTYPFNPALQISGSSAVTVSRESIQGWGAPALEIGTGVSGSVIVDDSIQASGGVISKAGVLATNAPGTTVTSDTVVTYCAPAVELEGSSTGASVENNIFQPATQTCANPAGATALVVSSGSVPQTTAGYNLIRPSSGGPLYSWDGVTYDSPAAFTAATGQGKHDLAKNPHLETPANMEQYEIWWDLASGPKPSPAIDSANAGAPHEPLTDFFGNPRLDDPNVANTGAPSGSGYFDRGAVELDNGARPSGTVSLKNTPAAGPLTVAGTLNVDIPTGAWAANGPPAFDVEYSFQGQGWSTPQMLAIGLTSGQAVTYTLPRAGYYTMSYTVSVIDYRGTSIPSATTDGVVVGAGYTAVPPRRLLDTRNGTGAVAAPVPAYSQVVLPISGTGNVPAADLSAVVANVTVTKPSAAGHITVYPSGESRPLASNLNFTKGQTVANLVTVPVTNGKVVLYNGSAGTVELILDLEGYYSGGGQGYKPLTPVRVLDTRNGTGGITGPVPAYTSVTLSIPQLPAGASAAVLNLTVTEPTARGHLTAYPPGEPLPLASNLNFRRGETVANLAIVPVVDGKVVLYNGSGGTTQMVADLEGFYGTAATGATGTFVPYGPVRQLDTRNGTGTYGPVGPYSTTTVYAGYYCKLVCPAPKAGVLNVTAVKGTRKGHLTVYPAGRKRPLASNLNYTRGTTVPNLVMVGDNDGMLIYNGSSGSVNLVADEEGYFISP